jgi:hypothetical protein
MSSRFATASETVRANAEFGAERPAKIPVLAWLESVQTRAHSLSSHAFAQRPAEMSASVVPQSACEVQGRVHVVLAPQNPCGMDSAQVASIEHADPTVGADEHAITSPITPRTNGLRA